jgi:hypothetical protein
MKYLTIFSLIIFNSFAVDKDLARQYSALTESYSIKNKSSTPNKAVVFISSRIDPDYMDLVEVSIDDADVSDGQIQIQRPDSSSKMRGISTCRSEEGNVTIQGNTLFVEATKLPTRVICSGDEGNYREAYSTFEDGI